MKRQNPVHRSVGDAIHTAGFPTDLPQAKAEDGTAIVNGRDLDNVADGGVDGG
jgi:hypothetical protein